MRSRAVLYPSHGGFVDTYVRSRKSASKTVPPRFDLIFGLAPDSRRPKSEIEKSFLQKIFGMQNSRTKVIWTHQMLPNRFTKPFPFRISSQSTKKAKLFHEKVAQYCKEKSIPVLAEFSLYTMRKLFCWEACVGNSVWVRVLPSELSILYNN